MFKLFKPMQSEQHMGGIASKVMPKRSFASCLKGGILEFLALIKDKSFIDNGISFTYSK